MTMTGKKDRSSENEKLWQEGVDSKALLVCLIKKLPVLLLLALTGAIIGGGLNLVLALYKNATPVYYNQKQYYIEFEPESIRAKDYYNAYTWNEVITYDEILGEAMLLLGDGYDRDNVKKMLRADILSDVRYLTVTISDKDKDKIQEVSSAIEEALVSFGDYKREFIRIYRVDDEGIKADKKSLFSWRMMLVGAVIIGFTGIVNILGSFLIGDCIYTKKAIEKYFEINVLGVIYDQKQKNNKNIDSLKENISIVTEDKKEDAVIFDFMENNLENAKEALDSLEFDVIQNMSDMGNKTKVILLIPFGVTCRQRTDDVLSELKLRNKEVIGAVIINTDYSWQKMYYGKLFN